MRFEVIATGKIGEKELMYAVIITGSTGHRSFAKFKGQVLFLKRKEAVEHVKTIRGALGKTFPMWKYKVVRVRVTVEEI